MRGFFTIFGVLVGMATIWHFAAEALNRRHERQAKQRRRWQGLIAEQERLIERVRVKRDDPETDPRMATLYAEWHAELLEHKLWLQEQKWRT